MLDNIFSCNEDNENVNESLNKEEVGAKTLTKNKYNKSHLVCHKFSFQGYSDNEKFDSFSFKSKYSYLITFHDKYLKELSEIKLTKISQKKEKEKVYDAATELYNKPFQKYYDEFQKLSDAKKICSITSSSL